ncbi:hypothetical protein [Salegentibacter chungangensis]|uniref:DUF5017 domain-containing protein n=1 Tax=Salegentibacter chungangensis TaxID=1335724 RepID=A0ABW3NUT5_9FLAO
MKRFLILGFILISMISCSTEEELDMLEPEELNLTFEKDGCVIHSFEYDQAGFAQVRNYNDELVVRISSANDFLLKEVKIYIANSGAEFPKNKKGLIPGRADYKKKFKEGVNENKAKFSLAELPENFFIAAYVEFESSDDSYEGWAGDIISGDGNWTYFEYGVTEFSFYAGKDQIREMTLSEVTALPSWDEVRKVYAGMLDEGVDRNSGTYEPSIWDLIDMFYDESRSSQLGDYTTTYSLGSGDCSDSAELTLRVIAD